MTEEQEEGVGSILDSSLLMLRLVNEVLDLSKIDAGKLEFEERDFDLRRLLANLEVNMRLQNQQKHGNAVQLEFHVAPDVPAIIYGDSTRMLQILYNRISNSCKFTSEGLIKLIVSVCNDETSKVGMKSEIRLFQVILKGPRPLSHSLWDCWMRQKPAGWRGHTEW